MAESLAQLAAAARACQLCAAHLPHGPNPVLRVSETARLLIVGQAPGRRVHATGIPWNDPSGDRLRAWLGLDSATFYDTARIAIVPIGLCYPGTDPRGGDRPPMRICAPTWHPRLRAAMPRIALTLAVGSHAQAYYLAGRRARTMTATVAAWRQHWAETAIVPLPHPSWRNTAWLRRNPWFADTLLPELRAYLHTLL